MNRILQSHWFGIVFLLPAALMIAIHRAYGLSDSALGLPVGEPPPTTFESIFNFTMVTVFYLGVFGYVAHSIALASRSKPWLVVKLIALAAGWWALLTILC